ncbi:MAG: hypothetical protein JW927_04950 [Deltaproteobacteria bacterium]|nr:hypothetical protein [Deltaproteobacteria bacterium]
MRCFSPLRVYLPWGAHRPDYKDDGEIIFSYPPEWLKPGLDINSMLDEYYSLARELGEKSRNEIIKRANSAPLSDESIKNIKAALMGKSSTGTTNEKEQIIRWHMLLHLADRFKKERNEAERMIEALRKRQSPLLNNADLGDNDIYPLETLAGMDAEAFINEGNLRQLLRAWHALFGEYTNEGELFLVLNRSVFTFLCDEYKNLCMDKGLQLPVITSCKIPLIQVQKDKSDTLDKIRAIFSSLKPGDNPSDITDLFAGYEDRYCADKKAPHIHICVLYMKIDLIKNDALLSMFSGKVIALAELIKPDILVL